MERVGEGIKQLLGSVDLCMLPPFLLSFYAWIHHVPGRRLSPFENAHVAMTALLNETSQFTVIKSTELGVL